MIGVRVTDQMQLANVMNAFQLNQQALEVAEQRVATGHTISQPSDNPFGASQVILYHQRIDLNTQLQRNLDISKGWLDASDDALNSMDNILQRARQVAIQLSNDTYTDVDRKNAADEIHQLLLQAVDVSNSKFGGQFLFAGTKTTKQPFIHDGSAQSPNLSAGGRVPVTYTGDQGSVTHQSDQAAQIQVNITGDNLQTVFNSLAQLEYDLNNSTVRVSGSVAGLNAALSKTSGVPGRDVDTFSINGIQIGTNQTPTMGPLAGKTIIGFAPNTTVGTVIDQINSQSSATGVTASLDKNGVLVLQGIPGKGAPVLTLVDQVTTDASGNDLTSGSGVPVQTNGNSTKDLGLSNGIDNTIGSADVVALDADLNQMQALRAQVGAKTNRVQESQTRLNSLGLTLTKLDSNIEDVDVAQAVSDLASRQSALQAALGVAAKALPPTLLDFLR